VVRAGGQVLTHLGRDRRRVTVPDDPVHQPVAHLAYLPLRVAQPRHGGRVRARLAEPAGNRLSCGRLRPVRFGVRDDGQPGHQELAWAE
jgi:hypothetical protein